MVDVVFYGLLYTIAFVSLVAFLLAAVIFVVVTAKFLWRMFR